LSEFHAHCKAYVPHSIRRRPTVELDEIEVDRRALLHKEWAAYTNTVQRREQQALRARQHAQAHALALLRRVDAERYAHAIQVSVRRHISLSAACKHTGTVGHDAVAIRGRWSHTHSAHSPISRAGWRLQGHDQTLAVIIHDRLHSKIVIMYICCGQFILPFLRELQ
jgi:hypothetical protein